MAHLDLPPEMGEPSLSGAGTVFRNRSFVSLWSAQVLSQLASNMVLAALMATVVEATGSNTANAVLILTFLVPAVAFSAVGGVLVERADARLIMLATNVLRAGGVVLFIFVGDHVPLILLINLFVATMTAVFTPAELTSIPRIVERRHLMAANSVFVLTINATFAIGFGFFGPLLLTTAGATVVYVVVAVMFGLAALAIVPAPRRAARQWQDRHPRQGGGTSDSGRHRRGERRDPIRAGQPQDRVVARLPGHRRQPDRGDGRHRPRICDRYPGPAPGGLLLHHGPGGARGGDGDPLPQRLWPLDPEAPGDRHRPGRDGRHAGRHSPR